MALEVNVYKLSPEEIAEKFKNVKPYDKKELGAIYSFDHSRHNRMLKKMSKTDRAKRQKSK